MRVALYVRVSTKDKQETENQLVQLREFAAQQNWSVSGEYIDRESGAKSERTEFCQRRMKIPHFAGRKFLTPEDRQWASLASDGVEPSAGLWRVLGGTEAEAKEVAAVVAASCPRGGTKPALRRSFSR
jgi:hypothetical protein